MDIQRFIAELPVAATELLADAIEETVKAVRDHGKAGNVTLNIKISPATRGDPRMLLIAPEVRHKAPQPDTVACLMFATSDGSLSRQDPDQRQLDLRQVDEAPPDNVRRIDP